MRRGALLFSVALAAAPAWARILVLDNFDAGSDKNAFKGATGAWDMDPGDESVSCKMSFNDAIKVGEAGKSLRLDYDLDSRRRNVHIPTNQSPTQPAEMRADEVYNGYYSIFGPFDLRAYKFLVFSIKGDSDLGYSRTLQVEMKDENGQSAVLVEGISTRWRRVVIPFSRFKEIQDWSRMKEFVFTFGPRMVTRKSGTLYVDDVYFASSAHERLHFPHRTLRVPRAVLPPQVDGDLLEWSDATPEDMLDSLEFLESGDVSSRARLEPPMFDNGGGVIKNKKLSPIPAVWGKERPSDASVRFAASWDDKFLYLAAEVRDGELVARQAGENIWKDDCLELYISPAGEDLVWAKPEHFQIGFAPGLSNTPDVWSWFQKRSPKGNELARAVRVFKDGYQLEAAIAWSFLGVARPAAGQDIGFSLALHDVDVQGDTPEAKLNWSFEKKGESMIRLGSLILEGTDKP